MLISDSIVTGYGTGSPESNPGGARFPAPVQTGPGAYPASCTVGPGYLTGGEQPTNQLIIQLTNQLTNQTTNQQPN
jgi:hypothetical protein